MGLFMRQESLNSSQLASEVGAAIAAHRKARQLTQAAVAVALGVEKETISRMETGVITPTLFRLKQLSELLECRMGDLLDMPRVENVEQTKAIAKLIGELSPKEQATVVRIVGEIVAMVHRPVPKKS